MIVPTKSPAFAREIKSGMNHGTSRRYLLTTFVKFFYINSKPKKKIKPGLEHDGRISFERKMLFRKSSSAVICSLSQSV